MNRNTTLMEKRNAAIRRDYDRMRSRKERGRIKYTVEYVIYRLSEKYYLSTRTIEKIIYGS